MNKIEPGDYRTEVVKDCPGFKSISERLGELIANMKERGELPEWI